MRALGKLVSAAVCAVLLSGCASSGGPLTNDQMIAEQKGAIIFYVQMNDRGCSESFSLGRYDPSVAGWRPAMDVAILPGATGQFFTDSAPSMVWLKAGHYGIISVDCGNSSMSRQKMRGFVVNNGTFFHPDRIWTNAVATFDVKAGEYVNIGELHAATDYSSSFLGFKYGVGPEHAVVTDIEPARMQAFKAQHPEIAGRIVTHLMQVPTLFGRGNPDVVALLAKLKADIAAGKVRKLKQPTP